MASWINLRYHASRIDTVLTAQPAVRQLFDHSWIHLIVLEGDQARRYIFDGWRSV